MSYTYEIHPRIGVARLGNSPTEFYLSPQTIGGLPIACDEWGNEGAQKAPVTEFKDNIGCIKRQAAKFRVFKRSGDSLTPQTCEDADIEKIEWVAHIANKKPVWYTFSELQGDLEFGTENSYANQHIPVNNPDVTTQAARQALIIDPGPRSLDAPQTSVEFSRYNIPSSYTHGSFPPTSAGGRQIDVLGELKTDAEGNLIALGGFGNVTGSAEIDSFRGAAGYWDDVADGYVFARVHLTDGSVVETEQAWLIVGSPKYAPEVVNISTLSDTMADIAVRKLGSSPDIFSEETYGDGGGYWPTDPKANYTPLKGYNPDYVVNFDRDVRPIMDRMALYRYVANVPTMADYARPNFDVRDASEALAERRLKYFRAFRMPLLPKDYHEYYTKMSKGPGQLYGLIDEDPARPSGLPMMPLNSGDNSVTNTGPIYKFDTLTPTQYFYLYQWSQGKFEVAEASNSPAHEGSHPIDMVDIGNCVGSPFSPGIEVTWSVRSPQIYQGPLHIKLAHTDVGLDHMMGEYEQSGLTWDRNECEGGGCEPGDLTKRMAIPWMADFHECTVQTPNMSNININQFTDGSGIEVPPAFYVYWWPPQSPFNVMTGAENPQDQVLDAFVSHIDGQPIIPSGQNVEFQRGINSAEQMINSWFRLGFLINRGDADVPYIVETERNFGQLAQEHINNIATAVAEAATVAKS